MPWNKSIEAGKTIKDPPREIIFCLSLLQHFIILITPWIASWNN